VRDSYVKQGWPAHRTAVVYNSFDLHNQRPSMPPSDDRPLRVALFGTLEPWKGHELFLKAAAVIALEHPTVHFFIVGGETLAHAGHASTIRRVIHELALSSRVTMLGHREDAAAVMTAMDVIVHCSVEAEPFGNVIVEAMSLGKAVIAADEGGPREILQNNVTGLLVAPRDPGALADAIRRLLGSREDRTRLGTCAAVAAAERFDHSRFIRELGALYRTEASGVES
jgi:glycosyltransferase involved in cell wall biosynthesis